MNNIKLLIIAILLLATQHGFSQIPYRDTTDYNKSVNKTCISFNSDWNQKVFRNNFYNYFYYNNLSNYFYRPLYTPRPFEIDLLIRNHY